MVRDCGDDSAVADSGLMSQGEGSGERAQRYRLRGPKAVEGPGFKLGLRG